VSEPRTRFLVGPKDRGKRLDRFLKERIPGLSRTRIQRAIDERVALSWSAPPRPATRVVPGGEVEVRPRRLDEVPLDLAIPVLARGGSWLAVDKPSGVPVHPVHRVLENSLIRILRRQEGDPELRLAHRLDAETTGVLLVCRTAEAARRLARAFHHGNVRKEYLALVHGFVADDEGTIDLPIGDASGSPVWERRAAGHGQTARTDFTVERRLVDTTLVRVRPHTGRRHQIRVHLAALGHPILGDLLYGRPDAHYLARLRGAGDPREADGGPKRQLLHCVRLGFPDPGGEGVCEVAAPLPQDFEPYLT
jgi:23S rRNA pseudouridine1911/1915/1917 synthase